MNVATKSLETLFLDIDEILEDLEIEWRNNSQFSYNPTAFQKVKSSGDNFMFCCPFHVENNPSCGILKEYPYTFNCFGCGHSGTLPQLVAHVLELPTEVHAEMYILKNYASISVKERPHLDIDLILDGGRHKDKIVSHLESELKQFVGKRHPYFYSRGFTERTLCKYEIGYDEKKQAMVIPVRASNGNLRFFKYRFVDRKGFLNEKNLYKKDIVYGLYYLLQAHGNVSSLFLTESETDTMSCYQSKLPAGAILGRILFNEQIRELLKAGVKEVNLFYDNDIYGLRCAYQSYNSLIKYPIRVNMVKYPGAMFGVNTWNQEEISCKDANDLLQRGLIGQIEVVPFERFHIDWSKIMKEE